MAIISTDLVPTQARLVGGLTLKGQAVALTYPLRQAVETLPPTEAAALLGKRRGFGSVRVTARIGESAWQTSLFPRKTGGWFLPIKKPVRLAEGLDFGDEVEGELELL